MGVSKSIICISICFFLFPISLVGSPIEVAGDNPVITNSNTEATAYFRILKADGSSQIIAVLPKSQKVLTPDVVEFQYLYMEGGKQDNVIPDLGTFHLGDLETMEEGAWPGDFTPTEALDAESTLGEEPPPKQMKEEMREEKIKEEEIQEEELRKEALRIEALRIEELQAEQFRKKELRKEELRREELRKEELRKEELRKEALRKEELGKEALRKEESRKKELQKKAERPKEEPLIKVMNPGKKTAVLQVITREKRKHLLLVFRRGSVNLPLRSERVMLVADPVSSLAEKNRIYVRVEKSDGTTFEIQESGQWVTL